MQTEKIIDLARRRGVIRAADVEETGASRTLLPYLADKGVLRRISRGAYVLADYQPEHETLLAAAATVPHGVICLLSALQFHEITTQMPMETWIAIRRGTHADSKPTPKTNLPFPKESKSMTPMESAFASIRPPRRLLTASSSATTSGWTLLARRCATPWRRRRPPAMKSGDSPSPAGCRASCAPIWRWSNEQGRHLQVSAPTTTEHPEQHRRTVQSLADALRPRTFS